MKLGGLALTGVVVAGALGVGLVGAPDADARKATREERVAMLAALRASNDVFAAEPKRCWSPGFVTRVSKFRPRTGTIWMNTRLRSRLRCAVGDGYVIMRRPKPKSTRWRVAWQGSGEVPSRLITSKMARELGLARDAVASRARCGRL